MTRVRHCEERVKTVGGEGARQSTIKTLQSTGEEEYRLRKRGREEEEGERGGGEKGGRERSGEV